MFEKTYKKHYFKNINELPWQVGGKYYDYFA
jgi:hypothetical protein